jgi:hypothetical protein
VGDVLGVRHVSTHRQPLAVEQADEPEPVAGTCQFVAIAGAEVVRCYHAVDPAGSVAEADDPLPLARTTWPAEVRHAFGAGKSMYISCDIGRYFNAHGDAHIGAWMTRVIDTLLPARQIVTNAPRTVEVTIWRQHAPPRTIIHLANRSVPWTLATGARQITEILPVHDVEMRLPGRAERLNVSGRGAHVHVVQTTPDLVLRLPVLQAHAAVVIAP